MLHFSLIRITEMLVHVILIIQRYLLAIISKFFYVLHTCKANLRLHEVKAREGMRNATTHKEKPSYR